MRLPHELPGTRGEFDHTSSQEELTPPKRIRCSYPCPVMCTLCHDTLTECPDDPSSDRTGEARVKKCPKVRHLTSIREWNPCWRTREEGLPALTAVLPGISLSPAPTRRKGQRRHRPKVSVPGVLVVAAIVGSGVLVTEWPPARWLVYAAWMMPMLELALLAVGQAWFRWRFRVAPDGKFRHAIIQVTTKGAEYERVSEIIAQTRSYRLSMDYQIWVVLEPGHRTDYTQADRVLVVPKGFTREVGAQGPRAGVLAPGAGVAGLRPFRREDHLQRRRRDADQGIHRAGVRG